MGFGALIVASTGILIFALFSGVHKVDEGHIGLYYFGGVLQNRSTEPGFNWMMPIISEFETVQVTVYTNINILVINR